MSSSDQSLLVSSHGARQSTNGCPRSPRAMVIDRAWRALGPGVEPLSGPGGAPLTRTVKLILLPLVVRPTLRPALGADLLGPAEASWLDALVREAGERLRATAQWFTLLKKVRRALDIATGNPQDLYFQRCFELATEHGAPGDDAERLAQGVLLEVVEQAGGRTVEALKDYLCHQGRHARVGRELIAAWAHRDLDLTTEMDSVVSLAAEVLDECGDPDAIDKGPAAFTSMVDGEFGGVFGRVLWAVPSGVWGGNDLPSHLSLTAHPMPPRPEVGRAASTAELPAPLDRTLFERLFVVLRASTWREDLPTVPDLVQREVGRSCSPLGLRDESLRVAALLGARLAVGLDPLGSGHTALGQTAAHRTINHRWRRESSVLKARRMTTAADPDGGALATIAMDLQRPWVAYMRRLWVRLHGRDVREAPLHDLASAWAVLDGVVRSVMMDHRARVRAALRALATAPAHAAEARSA